MKKLIAKLLLFNFFNDLVLLYPVYVLLFQKHGLDALAISMLLSIWAGTKLVLEIPSGILADKYSRRNLVLIGRVFKLIRFIVWTGAGSGILFGPFWYFAIGFTCWSISGALYSGTFSAFIYDELKTYGRESDYEKIQGYMISASLSGIVIALFVGGFVAEISYYYVFAASMITTIIAFIVLLSVKPVQKVQSTEEKNYFKFLKLVLINARKNIFLGEIIFMLVFVSSIFTAAVEFYPFLFGELGFAEGMVGFLFGVNYIFVLFGGIAVGYLTAKKGNWEIILSLIASFSILLITVFKTPFFLIGLFIAAFLITIFEIRLTNKIQKEIESHERATMLSISSFLSGGMQLILFMVFGLIIRTYGSFAMIFITGVSIMAISLYGVVIFWRRG